VFDHRAVSLVVNVDPVCKNYSVSRAMIHRVLHKRTYVVTKGLGNQPRTPTESTAESLDPAVPKAVGEKQIIQAMRNSH
jgi:hypothetical protein